MRVEPRMTYRSELDAALARLASIDREGLPCPSCVARRRRWKSALTTVALVVLWTFTVLCACAFALLILFVIAMGSFDAHFG